MGDTLRQVWPLIDIARFAKIVVRHRRRDLRQKLPRHRICAETCEQLSHRFRVSRDPKQSSNPGCRKARKEILQIHAKHDSLADVVSGMSFDRSRLNKSVNGWMRWNSFENAGEYSIAAES